MGFGAVWNWAESTHRRRADVASDLDPNGGDVPNHMIKSLAHEPRSATFPPALVSARRARAFLAIALAAEGIDQPDLEDRLRLVASELVTNAVLHARTDIEVRLIVDATLVSLEVLDQSDRPIMRARVDAHRAGPTPAHTATSGRGLVLVDALSDSWGVNDIVGHPGKAVWANFART